MIDLSQRLSSLSRIQFFFALFVLTLLPLPALSAPSISFVKDFNTTRVGSDPKVLGLVGGKLLVVASTPGYGRELMVSDETLGNFTLLKDFSPGIESSSVGTYQVVGANAYFSIFHHDPDGTFTVELWITDGTTANTVLLHTFVNQSLAHIATIGSRSFFQVFSGQQRSIWISDGTIAGTHDTGHQTNFALGQCAESLYYYVDNGTGSFNLWAMNAADLSVTEIRSTGPNQFIAHFHPVYDRCVYQLVDRSLNLSQLWSTDGTSAPSQLLATKT